MTAFNQQPEVCNVLGDSITLRLTSEQTDGNYSVAEFATPGGVGQPPHTHAWDETYLVLEGELNLNVNGEATVVAWRQLSGQGRCGPCPHTKWRFLPLRDAGQARWRGVGV